jgi:hypothetical protein
MDFDTLKALVSDDLRYYVAGGGMLGGEDQEPSAFAEFLRKARAETKDVIAIDRFGQEGKFAEGMNVPVDQGKRAAFWS